MAHLSRVLTVGLLGIAAFAGSSAVGATATPAPKTLSNPTRTCEQLTARFLAYLGPGMQKKLVSFVSPAFVIGRNNGTWDSWWPNYLADHPTFTGWNITVRVAKFSSPTISCLAVTSTTQLVNGSPEVSTPTPNLSTYTWQRGAWRIVSYARFNAM